MLLVQWQSSSEGIEWVGEAHYCIHMLNQRNQLYHVNLLKGWREREDPGFYNAEVDWDEEGRARSREPQAQVTSGTPASDWQLRQIQQVLKECSDVFREAPGEVVGDWGWNTVSPRPQGRR